MKLEELCFDVYDCERSHCAFIQQQSLLLLVNVSQYLNTLLLYTRLYVPIRKLYMLYGIVQVRKLGCNVQEESKIAGSSFVGLFSSKSLLRKTLFIISVLSVFTWRNASTQRPSEVTSHNLFRRYLCVCLAEYICTKRLT